MAAHSHVQVLLRSDDFPCDHVQVLHVRGRERISEAFELWVRFVTSEPEALEGKLVPGALASVVFADGQSDDTLVRSFHGIVAEIEDALTSETHAAAYVIRVVPRMHRLDLVKTQQIYQELSVPEIIEEELANVGLAKGTDFELRLELSYPTREFITQYKETDFSLINRLSEHLGIAYYFEHGDADKVIFTDHPSGYGRASVERVPYRPRGDEREVFDLRKKQRLLPEEYHVVDFNYRRPLENVHGESKLDRPGAVGGVIEYGCHVKDAEEAAHLARVRKEAAPSEIAYYEAMAARPELAAGARFVLEGHPRLGDLELLVVEQRFEIDQPAMQSDEAVRGYRAELVLVDAEGGYRPMPVTQRPRIGGVVNAVVDGEIDAAAELDEAGRYRVRFAFDVGTPEEEWASRPVRMAQPHAGPQYGIHFPLKPGVEVLIAFVDGDPDRPIIVGAVPNPLNPSPVTADNARMNRIKSASGCVIELFDG